jgi:hypothetical protein
LFIGPRAASPAIAEEHPDLCHGEAYYQGRDRPREQISSSERDVHSDAEHNERTDARVLSDLTIPLDEFFVLDDFH